MYDKRRNCNNTKYRIEEQAEEYRHLHNMIRRSNRALNNAWLIVYVIL